MLQRNFDLVVFEPGDARDNGLLGLDMEEAVAIGVPRRVIAPVLAVARGGGVCVDYFGDRFVCELYFLADATLVAFGHGDEVFNFSQGESELGRAIKDAGVHDAGAGLEVGYRTAQLADVSGHVADEVIAGDLPAFDLEGEG